MAFSLHLVGFTVSAYRWRLLLRAQGSDASIPFLIKSYIVGMFFNNFLPSTVGGDAIRAYDSWRAGQSKAGAVTVVFIDRFLGLLALVLFALAALLIPSRLTASLPFLGLWVALGVVGMLMIVWIIFMPPRQVSAALGNIKLPFMRKLQSIIDSFAAFRGRKDVLLKALGWSVLLQANVVIHYYLIAVALGLSVPFLSFFLIIPLAIFIMMVPISINGIGLRETAFVVFLGAFGVTQPEAVAFAWVGFGITFLQGVLGGVVYALRK
jgi:hypothetical protein